MNCNLPSSLGSMNTVDYIFARTADKFCCEHHIEIDDYITMHRKVQYHLMHKGFVDQCNTYEDLPDEQFILAVQGAGQVWHDFSPSKASNFTVNRSTKKIYSAFGLNADTATLLEPHLPAGWARKYAQMLMAQSESNKTRKYNDRLSQVLTIEQQ